MIGWIWLIVVVLFATTFIISAFKKQRKVDYATIALGNIQTTAIQMLQFGHSEEYVRNWINRELDEAAMIYGTDSVVSSIDRVSPQRGPKKR